MPQFRTVFTKGHTYKISRDDVILSASDDLAKLLGYESEEELVGSNIFDLGLVDTDKRGEIKEEISKKEEVTFETDWFQKDGEPVNVVENCVGVKDPSGDVLYYEGTLDQVDDRNESSSREAPYVNSSGKRNNGRTAAIVAHELNNQLTSIIGYADMCLLRGIEDKRMEHFLQSLLNSANAAKEIVRQLANLNRKENGQKEVVDLNSELRSMEEIIQHTLGADISLTLNLSRQSPTILADSRLIEQAVMNLVINARDAMGSEGMLEIETSLETVMARRNNGDRTVPGPYVRLTITDNGPGIPENVKTRIFEPFVTTKGKENGTGLGLYVVNDIVKRLGGRISVASEVGKGATFEILLPVFVPEFDAVSTDFPIV